VTLQVALERLCFCGGDAERVAQADQQRAFIPGDAAALQGLCDRGFIDLHLAACDILRGVDRVRHRRAGDTIGKALQRGQEEHDERSCEQAGDVAELGGRQPARTFGHQVDDRHEGCRDRRLLQGPAYAQVDVEEV
jgi:hypothetical protein